MDILINGILYLILAFCPYLVYFCVKTKRRAWITLIVIVFMIDLMVLHYYVKAF